MKKILILTGGWVVTAVGAILTPIPMPLPFPFPIGITMFLVGCGILTTHSKTFRRGIQYVRHRNGWLSRGLEKIAGHAPGMMERVVQRFLRNRDGRFSHWLRSRTRRLTEIVIGMVQRTSPHAHSRRARMRARRAGDIA
ncbi:MAG TPA: hypothetical protein VN154_10235 [Rhizomicrobium sp.]|nr:hypothetical protein [Rhizomicrobium sp.]